MTHEAFIAFAKTGGAIYMLAVFLLAVVWVYWPSRKATYDAAALTPLSDEDIQK